MPHAVLLGDSIFDNAAYVPGEPEVAAQLRARLPADWRITLLALDGDVTLGVLRQLERLPADATHLLVSCGGNDALGYLPMLEDRAKSVAEVLARFAQIRAQFAQDYRRMLERSFAARAQVAVCTIYDGIPGLEPPQHAALTMFNEVILREALAAGAGVVDLRLICSEPADYSALSPIEPSSRGGEKIARALQGLLLGTEGDAGTVKVYR